MGTTKHTVKAHGGKKKSHKKSKASKKATHKKSKGGSTKKCAPKKKC